MKCSELMACSIHWMLDDMACGINSTFIQLKVQKKSINFFFLLHMNKRNKKRKKIKGTQNIQGCFCLYFKLWHIWHLLCWSTFVPAPLYPIISHFSPKQIILFMVGYNQATHHKEGNPKEIFKDLLLHIKVILL